MDDFKRSPKAVSWIYSPISIIFILILCFFTARGTFNLYLKNKIVIADRDRMKKEFSELESRKEFLNKELSALNSNAGLEEKLRKSFNVKKEGEDVVVIVEATSDKNGEESSSSDKGSLLRKFIIKIVDFFE